MKILELAKEEHWNGRLQAPRRQLAEIHLIANDSRLTAPEWSVRLAKAQANIRWMLTFSARLQPHGPWLEYAKRHGIRATWPHSEENRHRAKRAQLLLCGLPALRVLSVDLGHRYAAACAVWEAVAEEEVRAACEQEA